MTQSKLTDVLKSKNFLVSILGIVLMALGANNINIGYTAEDIFTLFTSAQGQSLTATIIMFFINSTSKIYLTIKEKGFSLDFIKNSNFITMIITTVSIIVGALWGDPVAGIWVGISTIVLNVIYQLSLPPKITT